MKTRILIVDDDQRLLRLYSAMLVKEGYEVLTTSEAKEALALAVAARPSLILLDVMIPSSEGEDTFGSLSGNAATKDIPVVFLTSLVKEDEVEAGKGMIGGREYISKSIPMGKFAAKVKEILGR